MSKKQYYIIVPDFEVKMINAEIKVLPKPTAVARPESCFERAEAMQGDCFITWYDDGKKVFGGVRTLADADVFNAIAAQMRICTENGARKIIEVMRATCDAFSSARAEAIACDE